MLNALERACWRLAALGIATLMAGASMRIALVAAENVTQTLLQQP